MRRRLPISLRFWNRVDTTPGNGVGDCWLWTGAVSKGYGTMPILNKTTRVHQLAWEMSLGQDIPKGLFVCHSCDVKLCVNPRHLFLGTHTDNMRDKMRKNRGYRPIGELHHLAKLTEAHVKALRAFTWNDMLTLEDIGSIVGCRPSTVSGILNGRQWRHIKG